MNITPDESPIYGGGEVVLHVGEYLPSVGDKYYLVFKGSQLRHVTSAVPSWRNGLFQLNAQIPSHTEVEEVEVSGYSCSGGEIRPLVVGSGQEVSSARLQYVSDSAHKMAVFLSTSVDHPENLEDLELVCRQRFRLTPDVQGDLDSRLTAAFATLQLPPCWNMMGTTTNGTEPAERLLHFSARLGLAQLTSHFLTLPGSQAAVSARNHEGLFPDDLASIGGCHNLADLLQFCRSQGQVLRSSKAPALSERDCSPNSPLVVSTNLNWETRDLEYDISEVEKILNTDLASRSCHISQSSHNMKQLHLTKNGDQNSSTLERVKENATRVTTTPRSSEGRVLEENLRRLRNIHEGIQKIRRLSTKHIAAPQNDDSSRLSTSCPSLCLPSAASGQDACYQNERLLSMRVHERRTSLSSNSRSLDSTSFDSIDVKIRINDITPSVSQEFLQPNSPLSEEENFQDENFLSREASYGITTSANIGGTASKRLAKKSAKKGPVRRQSWSSLATTAPPEKAGEKQPIQRRWSLSSLDSDAEDTFSDATDRHSNPHQDFSPTTPGFEKYSKERARNLLGGSPEECSLSKSGKQSVSVPSMRDITADSKENVEPEKPQAAHYLSATAKNFLSTFKSNPLQKSLSTPTITIDDEGQDKAKQDTSNRQSICVLHAGSLPDEAIASHENEDCSKNAIYPPVSLAGVLRENQLHPGTADSDEEKPLSKRKKRSSIFFKKKPDKHKSKEVKKTPHQFVTTHGYLPNCDVCHKPFTKKQALKCENCLVVVHDSSCKDQVVDCNKFKLQTAQPKSNLLPVSNALPTHFNGSSPGLPLPLSKDKSLSQFYGQTNIPSLSEVATRSSFVNLGKMTSEERDNDGSSDIPTNMMDTNSASMESLDEGTVEISDLEDNQVLRLTEEEPETWHATVDKKVLKKLKDKEVKRQEAIYELIITEKHHCRTLEIMQKVYVQGMLKELNMSRESVERIFPCLSELLDLHKTFLSRLRERQCENPIVENIADILEEQFHDHKAEQMKIAYGQFCSQHIEALNLYKEWAKSDRKFQNFIKECSTKRFCKRKGIPECLLLVTQRITKYILVIETLIKAAKDCKEEQLTLMKVLCNLKEVISQVDVQVAEKEMELRLNDLYNRMDPKAAIYYRGKKFKKSDLIANKRRLIREGVLTWRSPRGKTIDVVAVMVSDLIFFLHENNQKYCFASLENKPGIVSLQKLLVRKKAGQDSRGMYLISSNPNEPEMIELFCRTAKEQKLWMDEVREAVERCPDEDEGIPSETEQEGKLEAARTARMKDVLGLLHEKDIHFSILCEEKMRLLFEVLEVVGIDSEQYDNVRYGHLVEGDFTPETRELLSSALSNASRLANSLYASGTNLSRSVSSAGEHQSETYISPLLPKRAETFGGFDNPTKEPAMPTKVPALKKKLLHLKENTEMSFFPSKPKLVPEVELGDSLEIVLRGFDAKTKSFSRPSSICGSPDKQHNRKNPNVPSVSPQNSISAYKEIPTDLLKLTATPLIMSQGKEQLTQIVELAHQLNTITCTVSHLLSIVESLKVQVAQSNDKISKLTKEKEMRDKRPVYRPEHQLEELRNLQKQLNHDRAIWQHEKALNEENMRAQKEELERLQEQVKLDQTDVTHQRELLYRKLDALQKQGIILSPSHTVLSNCISRDSEVAKEDARNINSQQTEPIGTSAASEFLQHRRTISCDFHHDGREVHGPNSTGPLSAPIVIRQDPNAGPPPVKSRSPTNAGLLPTSGKIIPLHLSSSATNLQKRQSISSQPVKQQLPLKLATNPNSGANAIPVQAMQGPQQVLPFKLALGSLPSSIPSLVNSEVKNSTPKRSHSAASSPSSTLTAPVHIRGGSSPALVTYPNSGLSMSPNGNKTENNVFHQLKHAADKGKNKRENNEEIFC